MKKKIDLRLGDCLEVLRTIPDNSIDSIVTDPPYGLSFMNKQWDYDVPTVEVWQECLRVLKPGGHLLSFAGSRTYHRMAVRIEDAGFEIRDQIMWVYGSGFPKSHNIGKAIDKIEGNEREDLGKNPADRPCYHRGETTQNGWKTSPRPNISKGNSDWEGWGTALKPAHEPIVMARKPLSEKSIVENVLKHGTGGINIDGSRIEFIDSPNLEAKQNQTVPTKIYINGPGLVQSGHSQLIYKSEGRWPANIIFDEEAGKLLDEQSGIAKSTPFKNNLPKISGNIYRGDGETEIKKDRGYDDKGGASRFFYCPKTSKTDRNEGLDKFEEKIKAGAEFRPNHMEKALQGEDGNPFGRWGKIKNNHPTVKPTDLMRYLINLVTPPNGTILDPFMGSGSTGKAAIRCGLNFIGIEKEQEYMDIAQARINHESSKPIQGELY